MIYLASPYSHKDADIREARFIAVSKAAAYYLKRGRLVFCPIAMSHPIAVHGDMEGDWQTWQRLDMHMLNLCCKFIILGLDGWMTSKGVNAERAGAQLLGMKIETVFPGAIGVPNVPLEQD